MTGAPRFWLLDACAGEKFAGVPLAAVEGAEALSTLQMQLIAREFNLPLTAFLLPPRDPTNSARARIFSPLGECRFRQWSRCDNSQNRASIHDHLAKPGICMG